MGNPFFDFFKYWPKLFKKKFRIEIWIFSFQICFRNQFWTLGSPKLIPKADLKLECQYFYSNFFFEESQSILKGIKKWISHCIVLKWPKVFKEIDHRCFKVVGPYFMGKSPCTT